MQLPPANWFAPSPSSGGCHIQLRSSEAGCSFMMADRYAPAPKPRSPTRRNALKRIVLRLPTWSGQFWFSWPGCLAFTYGHILRLAARSARNSSRSLMIYSALLHPKAIARESHLLNPRPTKFQTEALPVRSVMACNNIHLLTS